MDITRVSEKLAAFRSDYPATEYGLLQSFVEDQVGDTARVVGCCEVIEVQTGRVLARAYGTRALRAPVPNAQGAKDTRDPDRAMTQSLGRVLGLMGYADPKSVEGDTDEPDETGSTQAAKPKPKKTPPPEMSPAAVAKLHLAGTPPPADVVSTDGIKETLNSLDAMSRGKMKSKLMALGHGLPLPDQLPRNKFDELDAILPGLIEEILTDSSPNAI
jgi:hypothetical protein|tara:strand:- start:580 stop:1227 length:648 start_codon:yes stop_codon:yes gene_type:complete